MFVVDLSPRESGILAEVLESTLSELGMEIAATDGADFRDHLKERKQILIKLLGAIPSTGRPAH